MIKLTPFVLILLFAAHFSHAADQCHDSLFLYLKHKNIDSLTDRQYQYLMLYQKNCLDSNKPIPASLSSVVPGKSNAILNVSLEVFKGFRGYMPEIGIYVDDVYKGKAPRSLILEEGEHTVSLFSGMAFSAANGEEKKRMQNAFVKVVLRAGSTHQLIFSYKCDMGGNRHCDDNEWYFGNDFRDN